MAENDTQLHPVDDFNQLQELDQKGFTSSDEKVRLDNFRKNPPVDDRPQSAPIPDVGNLNQQKGILEQLNPVPENEQRHDGRSFISLGTEMGLEIIGSTVGAVAGGRVGRPVQGAAAGSASGQALFQDLQHIAPDTFGEGPETSNEAIGEIGVSGTSDLLFGGVGTVLKGQVNKFNPLNKLQPDDLKTLEFLEKNVGTENIPLSLIAPDSKGFALGENLAEGSFLSSGTFKNQRKSIQDILTDGLQHQADMVTKGLSREDISKNVLSVIRNKTKAQGKALDDVAIRIEMMLKDRGGDAAVDVASSLKLLKKEFSDTITPGLRASKELKFFNNNTIIKNGKIVNFGGPGGGIVNAFGNTTMSFRKSQAIVNDLTEDIAKLQSKKGKSIFGVDNASKLQNKLTKLRSSLIKSQSGRIKGMGDPELSKAFGTMQQIIFKGHDKFNEKLLTNMMRSDDLAATIITNTIKSPREMRRLKFLLGPEWRRIEGLQYQDLIRKHTKREGGKKSLNADSMLDSIDKLDPGMKKVMFNNKTMKKFTEFAEVLAKTQGDKATNIGTVFIELSQAGAVTSMLFGGPTAAATTILFGPAAFEKLFTNPKVIGKLIKAAKTGASKTLSTPATIISSILSDLTKAGIDYTLGDSPQKRLEGEIVKQKESLENVLQGFGQSGRELTE